MGRDLSWCAAGFMLAGSHPTEVIGRRNRALSAVLVRRADWSEQLRTCSAGPSSPSDCCYRRDCCAKHGGCAASRTHALFAKARVMLRGFLPRPADDNHRE
jgi:hypothetical protein